MAQPLYFKPSIKGDKHIAAGLQHRVRARMENSARGIVLGVSGGRDSVALLDLLFSLRSELNLQLVVAHIDHGLRSESAAEADFVEELAESYGTRCCRCSALPVLKGENVEAWCRGVRYGFFETLRRQLGFDVVATAHHQNDQAETVLDRIISGRFLTGAFGIAARTPDASILRPLIDVSREEIDEYIAYRQLGYIDDSSNRDQRFTRNRIRHVVLPLLERELNPQVVQSLSDFAQRSAADEQALQEYARRTVENGPPPVCGEWPLDFVSDLPSGIQWRVLREIALRSCGDGAGALGYNSYQLICRALSLPYERLRSFDLGQDIVCVLDRSSLKFCFQQEPQRPAESLYLSLPGQVRWQTNGGTECVIDARVTDSSALEVNFTDPLYHGAITRGQMISYFDLDRLAAEGLQVRPWQDGDSMRVWKRGTRKLKKLFQERKLASGLKETLPVVVSGSEIIWVPGVARSEQAPVTAATSRILTLEVRLD